MPSVFPPSDERPRGDREDRCPPFSLRATSARGGTARRDALRFPSERRAPEGGPRGEMPSVFPPSDERPRGDREDRCPPFSLRATSARGGTARIDALRFPSERRAPEGGPRGEMPSVFPPSDERPRGDREERCPPFSLRATSARGGTARIDALRFPSERRAPEGG